MGINTIGSDVQAAWVAYLKAQTNLTSLLANNGQIKESQWQGDEFSYPAVRISVDFYPSVNGCIPRATIFISVFSEEKTSKQASTIAGVIQRLVHRKPFTSVGVTSFMVLVEEVLHPDRSIFAWQSQVKVKTLIA